MTLDVVLAWHIHQPMFIPDVEVEEQCHESYRNLVATHRETGVPFCLNITGSLLDRLHKIQPELIEEIDILINDGLIEPLASGYNHPLIPIVPYESAERHVRRDIESKRAIFGVEPDGFWPTDLGWTHWMVPLLRQFGINWTVVNSSSLFEGNALPTWETSDTPAGPVLSPQVEATTATRELHTPYMTKFGDEDLRVLIRDHERSVNLFGSELGGSGDGALYKEGELDAFLDNLVDSEGNVVCIGEDGERINTQTVRLYRQLLERLQQRKDIRLRTGSAVFSDSNIDQSRFFPASTFQHDLRCWISTMDDSSYLMFLDRVQRLVQQLERRVEPGDESAATHLEKAHEALLKAEDSGVIFWRYAERTRQSGYEAAMRAYRQVNQGFDAL